MWFSTAGVLQGVFPMHATLKPGLRRGTHHAVLP